MKFIDEMIKYYKIWKRRLEYSDDGWRQQMKIFTLLGTPGIGKTTFSKKSMFVHYKTTQHIPELDGRYERMIENALIFSYNFCVEVGKTNLDVTHPSQTLIARIYYEIFCSGNDTDFNEFSRKFKDALKDTDFDPYNLVFDKLLKISNGEPIMVLFHFDEFNAIIYDALLLQVLTKC